MQLALTICILACIGLQSTQAVSLSLFACIYWALQERRMDSIQSIYSPWTALQACHAL